MSETVSAGIEQALSLVTDPGVRVSLRSAIALRDRKIDDLTARLATVEGEVRAKALEEAASLIERHVAFYEGNTPVRLVKTPTTDAYGRLFAELVRGLLDDEGTRRTLEAS